MNAVKDIPLTLVEIRDLAHSILKLYARLRNTDSMQKKTGLLEQARQQAEALTSGLQTISAQSNRHQMDLENAKVLQELGPLMEQILVMEKEYRTSVGGNCFGDTPSRKGEGS